MSLSDDDDLFDDEDSFADVVANLNNSLFETDSQLDSNNHCPPGNSHGSNSKNCSSANSVPLDNFGDSSFNQTDKIATKSGSPSGTTVPSDKALRLLKQFYGYSSFRHVQWEIIRCVTEDR